MTVESVDRCYLYRFYDADDQLLYVGIARDLGARFASHRRRSEWWALTVRGTTTAYPSRADAELAEGLAIHSEHPIHNLSRPTEAKIARLQGAALESADATQLVAEIERLRAVCEAQATRIIKMRGNIDAAREAYRKMRASYLQSETDRSSIAREYNLLVNRPRPRPAAPVVPAGDWGDL